MKNRIIDQFPVKGMHRRPTQFDSERTFAERLANLSIEGKTANNMRFFALDWIERLNLVSRKEGEKVGIGDNKHVANLFYNVSDLRKLTRGMTIDSQESFGETSDKLFELMMEVIDKTDESGRQIDIILDFVRKLESKQKLNLKKF